MRRFLEVVKYAAHGLLLIYGVAFTGLVGWTAWMSGQYHRQQKLYHPQPRGDMVSFVFNGCEDPCVINYSPGGAQSLFYAAAQDVMNGARSKAVINGDCASGCVVFADWASERVCITPKARFGFHLGAKAYYPAQRLAPGEVVAPLIIYSRLHLSSELMSWADEKGWFAQKMVWMEYEEAKHFWPSCDETGKETEKAEPEPGPEPTQSELRVRPLQPQGWKLEP